MRNKDVLMIAMNGTEYWSELDKAELLDKIRETLKTLKHLPRYHSGSISLYPKVEFLDDIHIVLNEYEVFK